MGGRSSECSSGDEDGDAEWKAAISSIATSSSSYACVSSFINGFSAASNHSTTPQITHNDDDGDGGGGLYKQKPQQLKHYQLKVSGFRAKRFGLVPSFFITSMLCGR
jgi:hypothetical protein